MKKIIIGLASIALFHSPMTIAAEHCDKMMDLAMTIVKKKEEGVSETTMLGVVPAGNMKRLFVSVITNVYRENVSPADIYLMCEKVTEKNKTYY